MSGAKTLLTAEEFDNYPFEENKRYELDEGELIEMTKPAYKHNRVVQNIEVPLVLFFRETPVGEVLNPENLFAISPSIRLAPDLAIILGDRRAELQDAKVIRIVPDIVVEVLSPKEGRLHRKLSQYFRAGVKEVWVVDIEAREVEIWTGPTLPETALKEGDSITSPLLPGFALPVASLFV
jgi:Uma2 family endonuclease